MSIPKKVLDELNKTDHTHAYAPIKCNFCTKNADNEEEREWSRNINFIAPFEVVLHDNANDIWVSFLGKVYNLTPLVCQFQNEKCIEPLLAFAGKDLSHWFDECTGDINHFIHPITGARVPYCPYGPLPHVNTQVPNTNWNKQPGKEPWWADDSYLVGYLTKKVRPLRIQNMLTREICDINVCMEDVLSRILERYQLFNSDADSYTWRYDERVLDMTKTLDENDIPDEREKFTNIGLPEDTYVPMLLLYYNDDLKYA